LRNERSVERIAERTVTTAFGEFRLYAYEDHVQRDVHLALVRGDIGAGTVPLVRVHLADTLRDVLDIDLGAPRSWTLRAAMARIAQEGAGVVVVLRRNEPPRDLIAAINDEEPSQATAPGEVLRTFGVGAQILKDLGVRRMHVLSAPKQMHGISAFDLEVEGYVDSDG
jgi:3,4-dihydroxy 2-butanone 4-phosphate synthase/GTP cyclohydrolase II